MTSANKKSVKMEMNVVLLTVHQATGFYTWSI